MDVFSHVLTLILCFHQGGTMLGQPLEKKDLGHTEIPFDVFMDHLEELSRTSYRSVMYAETKYRALMGQHFLNNLLTIQ